MLDGQDPSLFFTESGARSDWFQHLLAVIGSQWWPHSLAAALLRCDSTCQQEWSLSPFCWSGLAW